MTLSRGLGVIGLAAVLTSAGAATSRSPEGHLRHYRVEIRELAFQPQNLLVALGDTVTWTNHDLVSHTVTAADSELDSGHLPPGGTFVWVANGSGVLPYLCRYHPIMTGNLRVP